MTTIELLKRTKAAWPALSAAGEKEKNRLLLAMADALESHIPAILDANGQDMADAQGHISARKTTVSTSPRVATSTSCSIPRRVTTGTTS